MIAEAYKRGIQKIFELDGHVYAFDSTTIDRCLSVLERAKFRKHKGGIKMHTLYDVEAQVTAFVHITEVKVHDSKGLFDKSNFKNVNGLYGSVEPNYFNF